MIQRYYFDTSIFGGFFDPEFSKETKQIFDLVAEGKILCFYSDLCEEELILAPSRISKLVEKIPIAAADLNPFKGFKVHPRSGDLSPLLSNLFSLLLAKLREK